MRIFDIQAEQKSLNLGIKCGSCMHFTRTPFFGKDVCSDLGKMATTPACTSFTPDYVQLRPVAKKTMATLRSIAEDMNSKQANLLTFAFRNIHQLAALDLQWGQLVYFSISGLDYLDQYLSGYLIGTTRIDGDRYLLVSSDFDKQKHPALLTLLATPIHQLFLYFRRFQATPLVCNPEAVTPGFIHLYG